MLTKPEQLHTFQQYNLTLFQLVFLTASSVSYCVLQVAFIVVIRTLKSIITISLCYNTIITQ